MSVVQLYRCDGPGCGKTESGPAKRRPRGWGGWVWVPGILSSPPELPRERTEWHFCSEACQRRWEAETPEGRNMTSDRTWRGKDVPWRPEGE